MPIRPGQAAKYPPDWPEISQRIRFERAGGRCECTGQCGLHRDRRCVEQHGEPAQFARGKIALTTAHFPDHNPENCADGNLLAACARCHNRLDIAERRRGIKERARERMVAAGQAELALEGGGRG